MNQYNIEVIKFVDKWVTKFSDENIDYVELVDRYFFDDCENLGFDMTHVDEMIEKKYGVIPPNEIMIKNLSVETDSYFIGCVLLKLWRYFNHWAYDAKEILESEPRNVFITGLNRLKELATANVLEERQARSVILLRHCSCLREYTQVVVNAANRWLAAGGGVCGAIFEEAGYRQLTEACQKFKLPLKDGDAVFTPAFGLERVNGINHAVGPDFGVTPNAFEELFNAYYNSLVVLMQNGYHDIAFPLISSGIYGGLLSDPVGESTKQCCRAYQKFTNDYPRYKIRLALCAYTDNEYALALKEYGKHELFGKH